MNPISTLLNGLKRRLLPAPLDYRQCLFEDLQTYLAAHGPAKINRALEIGPRDGQDTRRILTLNAPEFVLIDLPRMEEHNRTWLKDFNSPTLKYISANIMYSPDIAQLEPFDLIWCTGVLYHNPEQLRMLRRLFEMLKPGGALLLESAVARRRAFRNEACVEIVYPVTEEVKKKYHISQNVTHLPSGKAMAAWLHMLGYVDIVEPGALKRASRKLARDRAAFIARRPVSGDGGAYYSHVGETGYRIGASL